MPFRRTRRPMKRRGRRRAGTSRWSTYGRAAGQLWKDVKYLKSVINVEYKRYDSDTGYIVPYTLGSGLVTPVYLTTIAQGAGVSARDGNSIKLNSIMMRFNFLRSLSATPGTPRVATRFRCILIRSIYNNNALPGNGDVLQNSALFQSPLNADESAGYRILRDKIYHVTADNPSQQAKWFVKLGHHVKWSGTSAAISDSTSGQMFLLIFADDGTNGDSVTINTRIRFIDN